MALGTLLRRPASVFYGWWIVASGFIVMALGAGTYFYGFTVYFLPLSRDLGLSRAATSLAFGLSRVQGGFEGPLAGLLIDRFGSRVVMFGGIALAGLGFLLLPLTHSYLTFLLVYIGVLSLGFGAGFGHATIAAVGQWFIRKRGLAMAILLSGVAVGGSLVTPLVAMAVLNLGWRNAALVSALALWFIAVPLSLLVRRSPESMGLQPDGVPRPSTLSPGEAAVTPQVVDLETREFTVKEALRTSSYWLLALANGLRVAVYAGVVVHIVPLLVWKGIEESTAAFLVGLLAFASIPARVMMGFWGDRWSKQRLSALGMAMGVVAMVLMLRELGLGLIVVVVILLALAESINPLTWALVGDFFGRKNFATLRGGLGMVHGFLSMIPPVFAGWVFDRTESYVGAVIPFAIIFGLAAFVYWILPRPRVVKGATGNPA